MYIDVLQYQNVEINLPPVFSIPEIKREIFKIKINIFGMVAQ